MSHWLDDDTEFRYECEDKHLSIYERPTKEQDEARTPHPCLHENCEKMADYIGFNPRKMNLTGKVSYEQNGVKAYRITDGKGNVTHISQRKYNYLQSGGESTKAFYTKEKEAQIRAEGRDDLLEDRNPLKERRQQMKAKISSAKASETPST